MECTYKLYNDDCIEVLKSIPDSSVDLIVTDPPYDVATKGGGIINSIKGFNKSMKELEDANIANGYDIFKFGEEFIRVMDGINIYIWCNKTQIPDYFKFYVDRHKCKFDILFWSKTNAMPTYSKKYLSDTEYLLYFRKGKNKCHPSSYEDAKTLYLAPINSRDKKLYGHPTVKPLEITERIIRNSAVKGQNVLDPFMGSGTTGVAAIKNGMNFIGIEINKEYYDTANRRIEQCGLTTE
jgi:site-specific DNA-methyltransferase (adenine-specific)